MEKEVEVKVSEVLVEETKYLFKELGLTTETAINMFLAACLREDGIPFTLSLNPYDYDFEDCDCFDCDCDCDEDCDCDCNHEKCHCEGK